MAPDHDHDEIFDRGLQFDVSTLLARRRVLSLFAGAGAAAVLAACGGDDSATSATSPPTEVAVATTTTAIATSAETAEAICSSIPEETAGPFPGDGSNGVDILTESGAARGDIRPSFGTSTNVAAGVPLTIELTITDAANGCVPLAGAAVYVWHCDREGRYSMYDLPDENYLRGVQETDAAGRVTFTSIFPGCYPGRWPHVHFEVYPSVDATASADNKVVTSQLALPEDTCDTVYATEGYEQSVSSLGQISLERDMVFSDDGAARQMATMSGSVNDGYTAALALGI